ncbi:MAG: AarF/UbiB family protein [bacterium]|nr:AarF/UbiB family protein [bacterium]
MVRLLRTTGRYFIVFEVLVDWVLKIFRQKIFGGGAAFISPQELREVLEDLGGSFLKFGQLAAMRPDYFPEEYCRELLGLLDEVPPIRPELLNGIFLKEYGRFPEEVFQKFERTPLASASFGQVHEAWLKEGERVAVKVQRPFVAEDFASDARFFSFLGWLLRRTGIVRTVNPSQVVREFIHWTERELDYLKEAEHLERLLEQVLRNKFPVKIPKVFEDYSTRRVLVMEFVEGRTLKSYYLEKTPPPRAHKLFKDLIDFELYSYFFDGFFHADPHPANVLVSSSGSLGLIDAGIASEVLVSDRKKMARFVRAVSRDDLEETIKTFLEMVRTPLLGMLAEAKRDYPQHWMRIQFTKNLFMRKIKEELGSLVERWHKASREGGPMHDKSPMHKFMELFQLAERAGIRMPPAGVLYARTFLSIDVAVLELVPDFDIPRSLVEFFDKFDSEFIKLEQTPDEIPLYLRPDLEGEEAEILKMLDEELKTLDRELLTERVSGMMESLE